VDPSRFQPRRREAPPSGWRRPIAIHIAPEEFDEVAAELGRTLDYFRVPPREKDEVLAAFAAHKGEVTEGSMASA
jgi:hemoglobin